MKDDNTGRETLFAGWEEQTEIKRSREDVRVKPETGEEENALRATRRKGDLLDG